MYSVQYNSGNNTIVSGRVAAIIPFSSLSDISQLQGSAQKPNPLGRMSH